MFGEVLGRDNIKPISPSREIETAHPIKFVCDYQRIQGLAYALEYHSIYAGEVLP